MLLLLVSDLTESVRPVINLFAFLYLGVFFLAKNQFYFKQYPRFPKEISLFILMYISSMLISTVFSVNIGISIVQVSRVIAFFILMYLIYSEINTEKSIVFILLTIVLACSITSLIIIINFSTDIRFNIEGNILMRAEGIYSNVNAMGGLTIIAFLILVAALILGYAKKYNRLIIFLLILNTAGLILNNSRSTIIGILSGLFVLLFFYRRKYFYTFISVLLLAVLIVLMSEDLSRIFGFYFRVERAVTGREYFWDMAVNMFTDNALVGVGPAGYKYLMYDYLPVMMGSWDELSIYTYYNVSDFGLQHSFYLFILSELGIFGLLVLSLFFFVLFKKSFILLQSGGGIIKVLAIVSLSAGIGLLIRGIFESINILTYGWLSGDLPFWLIVLSLFSIEKLLQKKFNN